MIRGEFHGAVIGKYKYGPDIIESVLIDKAYWKYKDDILQKLHTMPGCTESVVGNVTEI